MIAVINAVTRCCPSIIIFFLPKDFHFSTSMLGLCEMMRYPVGYPAIKRIYQVAHLFRFPYERALYFRKWQFSGLSMKFSICSVQYWMRCIFGHVSIYFTKFNNVSKLSTLPYLFWLPVLNLTNNFPVQAILFSISRSFHRRHGTLGFCYKVHMATLYLVQTL